MKVKVAQLCLTLCDPMDYTVHGILRQEYWSGLPFPSPGDLPDPGIKPRSPTLQADALPSEPPGKPMLLKLGLKTHSVMLPLYFENHFLNYRFPSTLC